MINEHDITLCGHGSGKPSLKNMYDYLTSRYSQIAPNGKRKGVVAVKRLKDIDSNGRKRFHDKYAEILGRNIYSQKLRDYVYEPYKDSKYYSDCSSSGCATYREIGYDISNLNTAGIYNSSKFEDVPAEIREGHIMNPEMLKVGDALLFVGTDPARPMQIGHVEYVYEMPEERYTEGWHKDEYGWWYAKTPYTYAKDEWLAINHHWYYFESQGYAVKGLQHIEEDIYYFEESGSLECSLLKSDDSGALKEWRI